MSVPVFVFIERKLTMSDTTVPILLHLDIEVRMMLDELARKQGVSRSGLMRGLIRKEYEAEGKPVTKPAGPIKSFGRAGQNAN
jgi:hypothetical protein